MPARDRNVSPPSPVEQQDLVNTVLERWSFPPGTSVTLINVSENRTYLIEVLRQRPVILRLHRHGYRSLAEIESELAWARSLRETGTILTPSPITGCDGKEVQTVCHPRSGLPIHAVLFEFADGEHPHSRNDLCPLFATLGSLAARTHNHSSNWRPPSNFVRPNWGLEATFGECALWGNWRQAPNVDARIAAILERAEQVVSRRLQGLGRHPRIYGLIHADMRLANLLVDGEHVVLIDFDDCGFGWHLYDFAAAVSFMECDPEIPELFDAWLAAYRRSRRLPVDIEREMPSFVMLRRLALLAWVGSRADSTEPQQLASGFASETAQLAETYLTGFG